MMNLEGERRGTVPTANGGHVAPGSEDTPSFILMAAVKWLSDGGRDRVLLSG